MSTTASNFPTSSTGDLVGSLTTGSGVGVGEYIAGTGTNDPGAQRVQNQVGKLRSHKRPPVAEDRHALAEHLRDALSSAKNLEAAASIDVEEAAISGLDLRESLRALW